MAKRSSAISSSAENSKLNAEIVLLRVQSRKVQAELEQLNRSAKNRPSLFDKIQMFGTSATSLIAIAGLLGSVVALINSYQVWASLERSQTNELISKLGSPVSSERYFAADSLLERMEFDTRMQTSIISLISTESSVPVKLQIARTVVAKKFDGQIINSFLKEANMNSNRLVNEMEGLGKQREKAKDDSIKSKYDEKYVESRERLRGVSDSILVLAYTKSGLECGVDKCGLKLSDTLFKRYSFVLLPLSLNAAEFSRSSLWGADFYKVNLEKADFSSAIIAVSGFKGAYLRNAVFTGARFQVPTASFFLEDTEKRRQGYTVFDGAELSGANFDGACLGGADFRRARNINAEQFSNSYNRGARFDEAIETLLKEKKLLDTEDRTKCAF